MLSEATLKKAIVELTGAELKILLATSLSDRPLRIDDYPIACELNRDTAIIALRGCVQAGYLQRTIVGRRHYYTVFVPPVQSAFPSANGGVKPVGNSDPNIGYNSDAPARTHGRTEEPNLKPNRSFSGCTKAPREKPEEQSGQETKSAQPHYLQETRRVAAYSAETLNDQHSLGYHIRVWNDARRRDAKAKTSYHCDMLFSLLTDLTDRRKKTHQNQGRAWTAATRELFDLWEHPTTEEEADEISHLISSSLDAADRAIGAAAP